MAIALEVKCGNAKVYVYDDLCKNISPQETEQKKLKVREIMGKIAATPGAAERLNTYLENADQSPQVSYIWHTADKNSAPN